MHRALKVFVVVGLFCVSAPRIGAAQDKNPEPLPENIVKAWRDAGAEVGWMQSARSFNSFRKTDKGYPGEVPAFRFAKWQAGVLAKLPIPERSFGLDLSFSQVTDAGLKELAPLVNLTVLDLWATPVTDKGVKELAGLSKLTLLNLSATRITGAALKELGNMKDLDSLALKQTRITGAGLKELAGLKMLRQLDLFGADISDAGLKELAGQIGLIHLNLHHTKVTDEGMKELAGFKDLQHLNLMTTKTTDVGMKHLTGLTKLSTLFISNEVTEKGRAMLREALPGCTIHPIRLK